jgi:hypothetical protein
MEPRVPEGWHVGGTIKIKSSQVRHIAVTKRREQERDFKLRQIGNL